MDRYHCSNCLRHLGGHTILTTNERQIAAHALYLAAEQFDKDALSARAHGQERVAIQFEKQAHESRKLMEDIQL